MWKRQKKVNSLNLGIQSDWREKEHDKTLKVKVNIGGKISKQINKQKSKANKNTKQNKNTLYKCQNIIRLANTIDLDTKVLLIVAFYLFHINQLLFSLWNFWNCNPNSRFNVKQGNDIQR